MSELAGSHPQLAAGLPRGRGRRPLEEVNSEQQVRILRAAIAAIAEVGYHASTIGDIVRRARVSREAFYRNYPGKLECFIAAVTMGQSIVLPRVAEAVERTRDADLPTTLRSIVTEYLRVCASEPEFARAWALELATAAGEGTAELRNEYLDVLAEVIRTAHLSRGQPGGREHRERPFEYYVALVGGCQELIYRYIIAGRTREVGELEEPIVDFLLQGLMDRPEG